MAPPVLIVLDVVLEVVVTRGPLGVLHGAPTADPPDVVEDHLLLGHENIGNTRGVIRPG